LTDVEALYERYGLTPAAPSQAHAWRLPLYAGDKQVGKATTTELVADLKKIDRAGSVETERSKAGDTVADGDHR